MCGTCGCGSAPAREHLHEPTGEHAHEPTTVVTLEQQILAKNDLLAARNRDWLNSRGIVAVNLMSSPGAGKTTLLERTVVDLAPEQAVAVIEGDQETLLDAGRIEAAGCHAVQINTGAGCHLDAEMLHGGLGRLDPPAGALVFVENVGNLVCPSLFDLGEQRRVVIMSVTEGADKPLKYPHMFRRAHLMLLNKVDLLPYVEFDTGQCLWAARQVNPSIEVIEASAIKGDGLDRWYAWLRG